MCVCVCVCVKIASSHVLFHFSPPPPPPRSSSSSSYRLTGKSTNCLNLASYNYLGFAENKGPCAEAAIEAVYSHGVGSPSTCRDLGESSVLPVQTGTNCIPEMPPFNKHCVLILITFHAWYMVCSDACHPPRNVAHEKKLGQLFALGIVYIYIFIYLYDCRILSVLTSVVLCFPNK